MGDCTALCPDSMKWFGVEGLGLRVYRLGFKGVESRVTVRDTGDAIGALVCLECWGFVDCRA